MLTLLSAARTDAAFDTDTDTGTGTQFLAVSGALTDRFLVTFRAPAADLAPLVPEPFRLDTHEGFGFLSVCAVEIEKMGIVALPDFLRFDNREFLYRLGVRFRDEPTFLTLRSDVSSGALAILGRHFSHYRPRRADVRLAREGTRIRMDGVTPDGSGDAALEVDVARPQGERSVFRDDGAAANFLLGMNFSADQVCGRVRVQPIEHGPWQPLFVRTHVARFAFVEELERRLATSFVLDGTLAVRAVPQVWKAARWA